MRIKAYTLLETLLVLIIISSFTSIFYFKFPVLNRKNEVISSIIHTQYISLVNHERMDFKHELVDDAIWFNMNGNVNMANTIYMNDSNQTFTIMLFTGRIHE